MKFADLSHLASLSRRKHAVGLLLHHEAVRCDAEPTTYANSKRAKRRISMRS